MTSNLYFAYSIKREFNGLASLLRTVLPSVAEKKKKKTRACDACSVRKTKCDDSRPCRHCVNNNLECTELRQRKKSGPKNLRKKTIASIQSISKDSTSQSPDRDDSARSSESSLPGGLSIDLVAVAEHLRTLPLELLEVTSSFTVTSISSSISETVMGLSNTLAATAGLPALARRLSALTYVAVIFVVSKPQSELENSGSDSPKIEQHLRPQLQNHISSLFSEYTKLLCFLGSTTMEFEANYHLALANLHMYAIMKLGSANHSQELIYLRSAISHFQLLVTYYGKEDVYMSEMHRLLYVWERHALLFSPVPAFRNSGVLVNGPAQESGGYSQSILQAYHAMLGVLDDLLVFQHVSEPYTWIYQGSPTGMPLSYSTTKAKLNELLRNIGTDNVTLSTVIRFLNFMLSFKVIQVFLKELSQGYVALELFEVIQQMNVVLDPTDPHVRFYIELLGVVSQMLEALRAYLQVTAGEQLGPDIIDSLLQLSSSISFYMGHRFEFNDPILSDWFARLIGPRQLQFMGEVFRE